LIISFYCPYSSHCAQWFNTTSFTILFTPLSSSPMYSSASSWERGRRCFENTNIETEVTKIFGKRNAPAVVLSNNEYNHKKYPEESNTTIHFAVVVPFEVIVTDWESVLDNAEHKPESLDEKMLIIESLRTNNILDLESDLEDQFYGENISDSDYDSLEELCEQIRNFRTQLSKDKGDNGVLHFIEGDYYIFYLHLISTISTLRVKVNEIMAYYFKHRVYWWKVALFIWLVRAIVQNSKVLYTIWEGRQNQELKIS